MEENWHAVEQQVRDRLSEARAAARIRTLMADLTRPTIGALVKGLAQP